MVVKASLVLVISNRLFSHFTHMQSACRYKSKDAKDTGYAALDVRKTVKMISAIFIFCFMLSGSTTDLDLCFLNQMTDLKPSEDAKAFKRCPAPFVLVVFY